MNDLTIPSLRTANDAVSYLRQPGCESGLLPADIAALEAQITLLRAGTDPEKVALLDSPEVVELIATGEIRTPLALNSVLTVKLSVAPAGRPAFVPGERSEPVLPIGGKFAPVTCAEAYAIGDDAVGKLYQATEQERLGDAAIQSLDITSKDYSTKAPAAFALQAALLRKAAALVQEVYERHPTKTLKATRDRITQRASVATITVKTRWPNVPTVEVESVTVVPSPTDLHEKGAKAVFDAAWVEAYLKDVKGTFLDLQHVRESLLSLKGTLATKLGGLDLAGTAVSAIVDELCLERGTHDLVKSGAATFIQPKGWTEAGEAAFKGFPPADDISGTHASSADSEFLADHPVTACPGSACPGSRASD